MTTNNELQPKSMHVPASDIRPTTWMLTEYGSGDQQRRTIKLPNKPSTVGRSDTADICVPVTSISKIHAKLWIENGQLNVQDLESTNGTHHNGLQIRSAVVVEGDLLQFANAVFRVSQKDESVNDRTMEEGLIPWAQTLLSFESLISERSVVPHFQPIITMDRLNTPGYEVLARSELPAMANPAEMFRVAERLGQEATLSELMRDEAGRLLSERTYKDARIFLNTHPQEFGTERLMASLTKLKNDYPSIAFTIEVHEGAVTQLDEMKNLKAAIQDLDMQLSYDDFGAGQGRLLELVEVPPDVLKFDMQLIRDIDTASSNRQELLRSLVRIAQESGSVTLAEGVETEAEHKTCVDLGFELGQGYFYGRPTKLSTIEAFA